VPHRGFNFAVGLLLIARPRLATAQEVVVPSDSAPSQIRAVLPAFYLHHNTSGDMLRMLYFEDRWRFIYGLG
jgi:hypothetical protein